MFENCLASVCIRKIKLNVIRILHLFGNLHFEAEDFGLMIFNYFISAYILKVWCCIAVERESRQGSYFNLTELHIV